MTARSQQREVGGDQHVALLEHPTARAQRVDEHCTGCLGDRHRAELHAAPRKVAMISARIAIAISAGLRAPIARPTGPRSRSIPEQPAAASRFATCRVRLLEPRQPM